MTTWASIAAAAAEVPKEDTTEDLYSGKQRAAVVDATALIKGFALERICDSAVTVQEVLDEVRDKNARDRLQSLPYRIRVLTPDPESVKTVAGVARETGDLSFLSVADVKLLALAFEIEKRIYGTQHLCLSPTITSRRRTASVKDENALPGWGTVKNPEDWGFIDRLNEKEMELEGDSSCEEGAGNEISLEELVAETVELDISGSPCDDSTLSSSRAEHEDLDEGEQACLTTAEVANTTESVKRRERQEVATGELRDHVDADPSVDDGWQTVMRKGKKKKPQKQLREEQSELDREEDNTSCVSCLTGDFGIQNVLLQMGMRLITPDGVRIRHLSTYGLKCASCFKVTRRSERVFCHNCGNATLFKVRMEVGKDGMDVIGGMLKPPQRRGAKCVIPPPKGGQKNRDAILSEDVMQQAMQRYRNIKKDRIPDVMAPEYNEDSWLKARVMKSKIKDQLPGRFGYPRTMTDYVPHRRKR